MKNILTRLSLMLFYLIGGEAISLPLDYDKSTKPAELTKIFISVKPIQLISIDEKNEIMASSLDAKLWWSDSRLAWNLTNNSTRKNIQAKSIWLPDLFVINTAEANGFVGFTDQHLAIVNNNGMVYLTLKIGILRTRCNLDFYYFPFDKQTCSIRFGSWQYDSSQLVIKSDLKLLDFSRLQKNQIWQMWNFSFSEYTADNRLTTGFTGIDIQFNINIKRKPKNYIINNIFPCFILNAVTFVTYFLNFTQQATMSICLVFAFL